MEKNSDRKHFKVLLICPETTFSPQDTVEATPLEYRRKGDTLEVRCTYMTSLGVCKIHPEFSSKDRQKSYCKILKTLKRHGSVFPFRRNEKK